MLLRQNELQKALDRLHLLDIENQAESRDCDNYDDELEEHEWEQIPVVEVDEIDLRRRIEIMNKEQRAAFEILRVQIRSKSDLPFFFCLHGSGGVGKSFVARVVIDLINLEYGDNYSISKNVVVSAPTGVAAKNISGITCHAAFSLDIEKFRASAYRKLDGIV